MSVQETKANLDTAKLGLISVLLDVEDVFRRTWSAPSCAWHTQYTFFRLGWGRDTDGNFRLTCENHNNLRTINQMDIDDLIITVQTLQTLWKALENNHADVLVRANEAHIMASKFLNGVSEP